MNLKQVLIGTFLVGAAVVGCSAPAGSESTADSQSAVTIHPCFGLACHPCTGSSCAPILPAACTAGDACCAGSTCSTSSSGQHAYCDSSNLCDACGTSGQQACGADCYGDQLVNASGTCQSCGVVGPSFSVSVTGPTSAVLDFKLAKTVIGQLQITNYVTSATVMEWDQAFDTDNTLYLSVLQPATTYVVRFTPTVTPTSTGSCAMLEGALFETPAPCVVGAACLSACSECNDGTCQCEGTITSCSNAAVPECSNPNACADHGGTASGSGCGKTP